MKETNWKQIGIGFLLIFLFYFLVPSFVGVIYGFFFPLEKEIHVIIATLLAYLFMLAFLLFYYRKSLSLEGKTFLKNWKSNLKIALLTWFKALLFMMLTNLIIIQLAGNIAENEETNRTIISLYPIFSCITMIGLGPFMEELLFRKGFKDAFKSETTFCLFTAFLFGLAHVSSIIDFSNLDAFFNNWTQLLFIISYGGIGYFFAKSYCETKTIFTSTVTHIIHNTFAVVVAMFGA